MGFYRHHRHKEQSNSLPSVREISCRLATEKSLNSTEEFYIRLESSVPERVCGILGNGSGWRDRTSLLNMGVAINIWCQINPVGLFVLSVRHCPDPLFLVPFTYLLTLG